MNIQDEIEAFKRNHGYDINLESPASYSEKITYKKFYDRNPLLTLTADKYRVRQYVKDRIGDYLIPLYWVGKNPEDIPFDELPDEYIIKPNNGSGRYILKYKGFEVDVNRTYEDLTKDQHIEIIDNWFKSVHGERWGEWCYQEIEPLIVIEKVITDNGDIPYNYKFCMFDGVCRMIYVLDRHEVTITHYDENWKLLPVERKGHGINPKKRPKELGKMIELAGKLSEPFDFVRVDFYIAENQIYFGELTHYPGSGWGVFVPDSYDFELGSYWKIGGY